MTTSITTRSVSAAPAATAPRVDAHLEAQVVSAQLAALMLALLVPTALALLYEERLINGFNVWLKPMKFQASLAVHFATLAALLSLVAPAARALRLIRWSVLLASVCAVLEVAYIMVQAGRGRASHFNNDTLFEEVAYALMGLGAVTIVAVTFIVGFVLWRNPRSGLSPGLRFGASAGLMFAGAATLLIGGYISQSGGPLIGVQSHGGGLPFLGWSIEVGDLRVPHFFATHAAQAMPLFALAWGRLNQHSGPRPAAIFAVGYTVITLAVFIQAIMGLPLLALA